MEAQKVEEKRKPKIDYKGRGQKMNLL